MNRKLDAAAKTAWISVLSLITLGFGVIIVISEFRSGPPEQRQYPGTLKSWDSALKDQAADLDGVLNSISVAQRGNPKELPAKMAGEYLEWISGGEHTVGLMSKNWDTSSRVNVHGGLLHVSQRTPQVEENYSYSRNATAGYVVVLHAYAEYETSQDAHAAVWRNGRPSMSYNETLRATGLRVIATVVDKQNRTIIARKDFPSPGKWEESGGSVDLSRLFLVEDWLARHGLKEATWPLRQDAQ